MNDHLEFAGFQAMISKSKGESKFDILHQRRAEHMDFSTSLGVNTIPVFSIRQIIPTRKSVIIDDLRYDFFTSVVISTYIWKRRRISQLIS